MYTAAEIELEPSFLVMDGLKELLHSEMTRTNSLLCEKNNLQFCKPLFTGVFEYLQLLCLQ